MTLLTTGIYKYFPCIYMYYAFTMLCAAGSLKKTTFRITLLVHLCNVPCICPRAGIKDVSADTFVSMASIYKLRHKIKT